MKKYQITCTERQLNIIAQACEVYGDGLAGNPVSIVELFPLKHSLDRFSVRKDIGDILNRYEMDTRKHPESAVAIDIWRNISRKDNFCLGGEPSIEVEESSEKVKAYLPPPLQWFKSTSVDEPIAQAQSPFSHYSIREINGDYVCYYHNFVESYSNSKLGESVDELKDWAENTHYPSQIKKYFIEIKEVEKEK